jgi:hypothetical protein
MIVVAVTFLTVLTTTKMQIDEINYINGSICSSFCIVLGKMVCRIDETEKIAHIVPRHQTTKSEIHQPNISEQLKHITKLTIWEDAQYHENINFVIIQVNPSVRCTFAEVI